MKNAGTIVLVLFVVAQAMGYPPSDRLMPDGAPVPEDTDVHEDSVAAASDRVEEYEDSDDSDMYMEPDGAETVSGGSTVEVKQNDTSPTTVDQEAKTTDEAVESRPSPEEKSLETESQNFFPSFAELFANHRLSFNEQQNHQRYRPNRFLGYFQRDRGYQASASSAKDTAHPLLGSGNFGVITGGTYYPEDKENDEYSVDESLYSPYYHNRGRINYYRNPKPQPVRPGDFFANFRDFADITAPPKSSFSHLSVVYANKNGSEAGRITEPRNIIETLRMLEQQEENAPVELTSTVETPTKKLSKGKRKLMKMKEYEEDKLRRTRVPVEPLLALS